MSDLVFVDTNVFVYRVDSRDPERQRRAEQWVRHLWRERSGRISHQVLRELYATVTRRLRPGMERDEARAMVRLLLAWNPTATTPEMLEVAWSLEERYSLSWWDALIVAAARLAGCRWLLSEDLQAGQELGSVTVVDPFATAPGQLG